MEAKLYYLKTFGCQMNYSDSERFAAVLQKLGYKPTENLEQSDVIVINSCSVRQRAEDRVVGMGKRIGSLRKTKPNLKVILTGCMTKREYRLEANKQKKVRKEEKARARLKRIVPWVNIILSVEDIDRLPALLEKQEVTKIKDYFSIEPVYESNFQAFVPISTGCNNFCSYCIVPYTRGREKSRPLKEIVHEVKALIRNGYKEITLLGQNVNSYGNDLGESNLFPKLLHEIDQIKGEYWIHFISSHPKDLSDELIEVVANGNHITPQIHFAMQSGSNEVLERMNRPYTIERYLRLVEKIKEKIPHVAVTTDVIVGFPGETEEDLKRTAEAMRKAKFAMAYLNEYSPRKGTKSYEMKDDVPSKVKHERKDQLNTILGATSKKFNEQFLNKKVIVLLTLATEKGVIGHTAQGISVRISLPATEEQQLKQPPIGTFTKVLITEIGSWGMKGEIRK